jgi:autophagy-related protein 13
MEWRTWRLEYGRPKPLIVEIYLDLSDLNKKQSLVWIDEDGNRWNVAEALDADVTPHTTTNGRAQMNKTTHVTLERWEILLDDKTDDSTVDKDKLSVVYKRAIPLFRSLYTYARTLPAFRFSRRVQKLPLIHPSLVPKYRVLNGKNKQSRTDTLNVPLSTTSEKFLDRYEFEPLQCPAGTLRISVEYRSNSHFRVDDAESLLSSHFLANPPKYYFHGPSLPRGVGPNSMPVEKNKFHETAVGEGQVYGSMATFHKTGNALAASPVSAIRAMQDNDLNSSSATPPPHKMPPNHRTAQGPKSSLRSDATPAYPRRPSVSFQPFKAGSLASSPASGLQVPPSPTSSVGRHTALPSGVAGMYNPLAQARSNRNSLTTLPQHALRTPSLPNETAIASSGSSSPKPAPINRYSSSFSHRRSRFSTDGGGSKGDNDQGSSGKPSPSSSAQPGSDLINEGQAGGSTESVLQTDDDNLKDFIRLLEQKKELKSFRNNDSASRDATMRRTTAALNKYQRMRDSNAALSDSMSSSMLLHRSSSSSSRQLSSVPPMIHGTSASTSSSPGKPVSPHTPHTPAIPSRLSAGAIVNYSEPRRSRSRGRRDNDAMREEDGSDTTTRDNGTNAIDIPTSPRPWASYARRSSSVAQQQRALEEEPDIYDVRRSASLPAEEMTELSISELLQAAEEHTPAAEEDRSPEPDTLNLQAFPFPTSRADSSEETSSRVSNAAGPVLPMRNRLSRGRRGSPSFSSERGSRYSAGSRASAALEEDELIFHLSELGSASRRSIEEGRGGSANRSTERRRGGASGGLNFHTY